MYILVCMYRKWNTHMHVDFATIPPPYLWVLVPHEGGDGTLPIGVRHRCREMVLGGHLSWYYWRDWSINRGMKRITSFGNTLSLFILTSQNSFPLFPCCQPKTAAAATQKQQQQQPKILPFSATTHTLSPSHSLTKLFLLSLYKKKTSFTYFISSKDQIE